MSTKSNKINYWIATGIVAFILAGSGITKLMGGEQVAEMAKNLGGSTIVTILGVLELHIVAFWVIKRTGVIGSLLAIAYLGGAIAVNLVSHQSIIAPIVISVITWAASAYRFPELTQRLFSRNIQD